jgi:hypothetical protein
MSHESTIKLDYEGWQSAHGLVENEEALLRLSQNDGEPGLSRTDIDIAMGKGELLPHMPGFTRPEDTKDPIAYIMSISEYAQWKERYAGIWQHYKCTPLFVEEAQTLYETLHLAYRADVPAHDLVAIMEKSRMAYLQPIDQIATLRSYIIFKEAQDINKKGKLVEGLHNHYNKKSKDKKITSDFDAFTAFVIDDFLNGKLIVKEPNQACMGGKLYSGNYEWNPPRLGGPYFQIGSDVKKDPLWLRYVTIHEGYHHYLRVTKHPSVSGDEVRVHHTSMNYLFTLTQGINYYFRPERSLFEYPMPESSPSCHLESVEKMETKLKHLPETLRNRYLQMIQDVLVFDFNGTSKKIRSGFQQFCQRMYELSYDELINGKPMSHHYPELREMYNKSGQKDDVRGNVLNILSNILAVHILYYNAMPRDRAPYPFSHIPRTAQELRKARNLDDALDYFRRNLSFDIPENIPKGAFKGGEYRLPDGKLFSPVDMLLFYALTQLRDPQETKGILPIILEAFERYPVS